MTTIVNPAGTITTVYNRGGTTIYDLFGTGTTQATAAPIIRYSEVTVVLASEGTGQGVLLPTDAEVGDVIEIYHVGDPGTQVNVYPGTGDAFTSGNSHDNLTNNGAFTLRKLTSSQWGIGGKD